MTIPRKLKQQRSFGQLVEDNLVLIAFIIFTTALIALAIHGGYKG
jgi:hypothetical protein